MHFIGQILSIESKLSVKLKFCTYLVLRLKTLSVRGVFLHPVFMGTYPTINHLVTRFNLMYLVDEFFCLFLMLLNEMRTVGESKNFGVNQKDEGGR